MNALHERVYTLAEQCDRHFRHRWVLSPAHVQAFHDEVNEDRRRSRERLWDIASWLPGLDPTQHLKWSEPLPPPDYTKADEFQLLGWPVRIADVEEITLERLEAE